MVTESHEVTPRSSQSYEDICVILLDIQTHLQPECILPLGAQHWMPAPEKLMGTAGSTPQHVPH